MTSQRSSWVWVAGIAAVLALLGGVIFSRTGRTPSPAQREVSASELTLREGRSYWKDETVPFSGIITETYPGGSVKSRSMLLNGLLHGVSEGWHTNGTLQVREHFLEGFSHGLRTKWFENGKKMSEAPIERGKIQGIFHRWHENGALAEEITMKDNQPDGISRSYYPSGAAKALVRIQNGQVIEQQSWPDGQFPDSAALRVAK